MMDKFEALRHITRLAQIAEELDQTSPEAANLVDETIEEAAEDLGLQKPENANPEVNPDLFPKVDAPVMPSAPAAEGDIDQKAQEIARRILDTPEFKEDVLPLLEQGLGSEELTNLMRRELGKME